jgi:hypothetical protein
MTLIIDCYLFLSSQLHIIQQIIYSTMGKGILVPWWPRRKLYIYICLEMQKISIFIYLFISFLDPLFFFFGVCVCEGKMRNLLGIFWNILRLFFGNGIFKVN